MTKKKAKDMVEEIIGVLFPHPKTSKTSGRKITLKGEKHPAVLAYAKRIAEMSGRDFDDVLADPPAMLINYKRWIYGESV